MRCQIIQSKGPGAFTNDVIDESELEVFMASQGAERLPDRPSGSDAHLTPWLRGKPSFRGFAGPMGDSFNGENVLRYEDAVSNRLLSD